MNFKTKPFWYQQQAFDFIKDLPYGALFMEQGLGKTKVAIDNNDYLLAAEKIQNILVVAPNGIQSNWAYQEYPRHSWFHEELRYLVWNSTGMRTKKGRLTARKFLNSTAKRVLYTNVEALRVKDYYAYFWQFLSQAPSMMIIDESTTIKNVSSQQGRAAVRLGEAATYRRILTGTPVTEGTEELWNQIRFLSQNALPHNTYTSFKADFCIEKAFSTAGGAQYRKIVGYKNSERLRKLLLPFAYRLTKEDGLDLPPKRYDTMTFELPTQLRKTYDTLRDEAWTELESQEGHAGVASYTHVLAAMTKLAQVACGFIKDDEERITPLSSYREEYLVEKLKLLPKEASCIIWFRFIYSLQHAVDALEKAFGKGCCVTYYGKTKDRSGAVQAFQTNSSKRFFLTNKTGARGLTLVKANYVIYFNNEYSLETRLQSEDRVHRIGQQVTTFFTDMIAHDTVDVPIWQALQTKKEFTQDLLGNWRNLL